MGSALGISAFYHDSAAALVSGSSLVAAAQQERFSRVKHDAIFPIDAAQFCLTRAGLRLRDLDAVVFYEEPLVKRDRIIDTLGRAHGHQGTFLDLILPDWLAHRDFTRERLRNGLRRIDDDFDPDRVQFAEHHESHAASAYYPSPFAEAAILTVDGVGEWATTSIYRGRGMHLERVEEIRFPNSIGLLYAAFTAYLGFKVNDGEYKMMGLAPYGEPRYERLIREHFIDLHEDGSFALDQQYFDNFAGDRMFNDRFAALFGAPPRGREEPFTQFHMDVAASIQNVTTTALLGLARAAVRCGESKNLCLAGGVALNCVTNGRLLRSGIVERVWIQPAAGDAGGAVGAAFIGAFGCTDAPRERVWPGYDGMSNGSLGPEYTSEEIQTYLSSVGATYQVLGEDEVREQTVDHLVAGRVVGWFQGRMEFGPRALGNRSILADPRSPTMQATLNGKTKARESFRPFAPAVLQERSAEWFDLDVPSPYMLLVAEVTETRRCAPEPALPSHGLDKLNQRRSVIPAVTHVDYSARVQTVDAAANPHFHALISAFAQRTGVPVLVNTSFNVSDEPIVCSPEDAYRCFLGTEMDVLVMGNCVMLRAEQHTVLPMILFRFPTAMAFDYAHCYCTQWYSGGTTHLVENDFTADLTSQPAWHTGGSDVRHSTKLDTWWEALERAVHGSTLIVACGGSTTAFNINWPAFVGPRLTELGHRTPVVTVNLGQPQFATFDDYFELEWFLREAQRRGIVPDLVVSLDGLNDIAYRLFAYTWATEHRLYDVIAPDELRLLDQLGLRRVYDRIAPPERLRSALTASMDVPLADFVEFLLPEATELDLMSCFEATVSALRRLAANAGIPCLNVLQPILTRGESQKRERQLRATYAQEFAEFRAAHSPVAHESGAQAFERFRRSRSIRMHLDEAYAVSADSGMRAPIMLRTAGLFERVSALWRKLGAEEGRNGALDLYGALREEAGVMYRDDGVHYTLDGSRTIADRIARWLLEAWPDVLSGARRQTVPTASEAEGERSAVAKREVILAFAAAAARKNDERDSADGTTSWRHGGVPGIVAIDDIREVAATLAERPATRDPEPGNVYPFF